MTRADVCVLACAELFRGDGEILVSPMGVIPSIAARLARSTFAPDILLTDGVASLVDADGVVEGWMPYRRVFDTVWSGRRHVMMGASQLDAAGNQNISCVGPHERPTSMLIGARGAPGNTACHATSYWVPRHDRRVFVERVDFVSGVGLPGAAELRGVVSDLAVFGFEGGRMTLRSIHPGVSFDEVQARTSFALTPCDAVTPEPSEADLALIRQLDPQGRRLVEVPS